MIIFILLFAYFGFGLFLLSKTKLKLSTVERGILAVILSISLLSSLITMLGQFIDIKSYYLLFGAILVGVTQYKSILVSIKYFLKALWRNKTGSIFMVFCISIFSSTIVFSGITQEGSMSLQEVHDSVWHISLIENLQKSIPPLHPSTSSITLTNYHYFYDIFLAGIGKFSSISTFVLYYQFSVIFLGIILTSSAYILGNRLNGKLAGFLLTGVTIFAGSFSYLIPFFNPGQMWHESSFWVSQTLVMIVNPQIIYTLAVTYIFIFLLKLTIESNPKKLDYYTLHGLLILFASTSIGFKSYAWVILTAIYGVFLLFELVRYKSLKTVLIGLAYLIISAPLVWLITKFKGNSFIYEPMWFTNSMIESPDRVNYLEWKFLQDHYLFKKNWLRFYEIEIKKVAIFYFGNLGVRSIFILMPILIYFKKNKSNISIIGLVFFGFIFSSIFPLIFLQSGTVWNSIQFWYYTLIFANILAVIFLVEILKNKSKVIKSIVILILVLISLPTSIKTIYDKNFKPKIIDEKEVLFLKAIDPKTNLLICSDDTMTYQTSIIKSLTKANVYLANPSQLELIGSDLSIVENYENIVDKSNSEELTKLIDENNITTIICNDKGFTEKFSRMLNINSEQIGSLNVFKL